MHTHGPVKRKESILRSGGLLGGGKLSFPLRGQVDLARPLAEKRKKKSGDITGRQRGKGEGGTIV